MRGIIVKLLNCFIVNHPFCSPPYKGGVRGGSNLAIEQFNNCKSPKGFTLIELLVVVAVLGILAGGILIALNIGGVLGKANLTKAKKFAAQLERGLVISQVGKWSFEGNVNDTSGYNNTGTLQGNATYDVSCDKLGFGQCLKLDGDGDYVDMNTKVLNSAGNFTLSAWIKPTAAISPSGPYPSIVSEIGSPAAGQFILRITDTFRIQFFRQTGVLNNTDIITTNTAIALGQWYHIVAVNLGGTSTTLQVYINGTKDSAVTTTSFWGGSVVPRTLIGYDLNGYFTGLIDEVQIYSEALTLSQIQHLYAQGVISRALAYK